MTCERIYGPYTLLLLCSSTRMWSMDLSWSMLDYGSIYGHHFMVHVVFQDTVVEKLSLPQLPGKTTTGTLEARALFMEGAQSHFFFGGWGESFFWGGVVDLLFFLRGGGWWITRQVPSFENSPEECSSIDLREIEIQRLMSPHHIQLFTVSGHVWPFHPALRPESLMRTTQEASRGTRDQVNHKIRATYQKRS